MHTLRLLDEAISLAGKLGYEVRHDHLGGDGTAHCTIGEQRLLVVDLAQPIEDQLEKVLEGVRAIAPNGAGECSPELESRLLTLSTHRGHE